MSIRPAKAEEQRLGCRLAAPEERPRRAPNPPPATNPGRRSGESTGIHRRKIAKSIALQEETRNSKKTGLSQRGGDFADASRRCDVSRAGGSWNKRAEFLGYQGSHCAAVDLEEKRPWILVDSGWIPRSRITRA